VNSEAPGGDGFAMINLSRRQFIETSAASLALAGARFEAKGAGSARVSRSGKLVRAVGDNYDWERSAENDRFRFMDKKGRVMVEGKLQPAVLVQPAGQQGVRQCISGKPATWQIKEDRLTVAYELGPLNGRAHCVRRCPAWNG
jgi:hypothetical protein